MKTIQLLLVMLFSIIFSMNTLAFSERKTVLIDYDGTPMNVLLPPSNDILTGDHTDLECLALNIYYESRGESILGQELVAQVTMNRYRMKGYPMTICGVVKQKKQFSWTKDGLSDMPTDLKAYAAAQIMAISFMYLDKIVNHEDAFKLTNFHSLDELPKSWEGHVTFIQKEMNHTFYTQTRPIVYEIDGYTIPNSEKLYASIRI
jgi:hypothetical protein